MSSTRIVRWYRVWPMTVAHIVSTDDEFIECQPALCGEGTGGEFWGATWGVVGLTHCRKCKRRAERLAKESNA